MTTTTSDYLDAFLFSIDLKNHLVLFPDGMVVKIDYLIDEDDELTLDGDEAEIIQFRMPPDNIVVQCPVAAIVEAFEADIAALQ